MSEVYETPAILLRQIDLPDEDRLGVFFTYRYGKRTVLLKGIKKHTAKLQYRLREGALREIEFIRGRGLDRLTAIHQDEELQMTQEYQWILSLWMCAFIDSLVEDEGEEPELFVWAIQGMNIVRESSYEDARAVFSWLVIRVMALLGYGLDVTQCVITGKKKSPTFFMSIREGGLVSYGEREEDSQLIPVSREEIALLRRYQRGVYTGEALPMRLLEQYIQWYDLPAYPDFLGKVE